MIVTLFAYLSPYANPKHLWPVSVIAVFYPWLLLFNFIFIVFWMFNKFRYALISVATILLGFNYLNGFIGFNSSGYMSSPDQIEILSYNTQNLYYIYKTEENRKARTDKFFKFMKDQHGVDIICAQELGLRSIELWNKKMKFPHVFAPEKVGPVIFSNHPISDRGQIHSEVSTINSCIWADISIKGTTYRIYNLHMESNKITRTAEKVIEEVNLQNKETWSGVKAIIKRYKNNASLRIGHAERIRAHMLESPYPIILAGDFNDVPMSYLYHILSSGMNDSFIKKGRAFGTTFAGKIPALRIDYILTDSQFKILDHKIMKEGFSDHYPIKSVVQLKQE
ncbi:endonuclease [Portibacter lacus]|uniref:Endonuclease n=1 Tax=Portibacter lacus TaxID=1099794 RepID=A0AA37STT5_9BACT|nr:endonuclease [Portibacter lacus]